MIKNCQEKCHPGNVIILDGGSSVGKTSIIEHLAPLLGPSYKQVAIDNFVNQVFQERKDLRLPDEVFFEKMRQQTCKMYDEIIKLTSEGKNVLVDTLLAGIDGEKTIACSLEKLKDLSATLILVHCPLEELSKRIEARNKKAFDENNLIDIRPSGEVFWQFSNVYEVADNQTENQGNMLLQKNMVIDLAKKSFAATWLNSLLGGKKLWQTLVNKFGFNNRESIVIKPRLSYDFIVNNGKNSTPEQCAKQIKHFLDTRKNSK